MRRVLILATTAIAALVALAGPAVAAWSTSGDGAAAGAASTMPGGAAPTVAAGGADVRVSWPAATFPNGAPVEGYVIHRYDANGSPAGVGAACAGIVTTTSCTESGVPSGAWTYTDTPVQGGWTGQESGASPPAAVG